MKLNPIIAKALVTLLCAYFAWLGKSVSQLQADVASLRAEIHQINRHEYPPTASNETH